MAAKAKDRSARKQAPQCQCHEQIKDILRRLELLEVNTPKISCVIKPAKEDDLLDMYEQFSDLIAKSIRLKSVHCPSRPEFERFIKEVPHELVASEVKRSFGLVDVKKAPPKKGKR